MMAYLLAALLLTSAFAIGTVRVEGRSYPHNVTVDPNTLTISGVSAGGAMAIQFQFAYSSIVRGVGVIAGVPYRCAGGGLIGALACLLDHSSIVVGDLIQGALDASSKGLIDSPENLKNHTVVEFSGKYDVVVNPAVMQVVDDMYRHFGVKHLTSYFNYSADHAWITDSYGNACWYLGLPFINNCDLDFAGDVLRNTFADLGVTWNNTRGVQNLDNLYQFDQTEYGADPALNSLADHGYIYIPAFCTIPGNKCHMHVAFHGCIVDKSLFGDIFPKHSGYSEWAESNHIIVLYPQAISNFVPAYDPMACFDWWGYVTPDYAYKGGGQLGIIRLMIEGIGGF